MLAQLAFFISKTIKENFKFDGEKECGKTFGSYAY
jgi:hypothetical protein